MSEITVNNPRIQKYQYLINKYVTINPKSKDNKYFKEYVKSIKFKGNTAIARIDIAGTYPFDIVFIKNNFYKSCMIMCENKFLGLYLGKIDNKWIYKGSIQEYDKYYIFTGFKKAVRYIVYELTKRFHHKIETTCDFYFDNSKKVTKDFKINNYSIEYENNYYADIHPKYIKKDNKFEIVNIDPAIIV